MLSAAIDYLHQGFSILPIRPDTKKPYLNSWVKLQTKPPTQEQVTNWFNAFADANIAIVTGEVSGVVVIDIDDSQLLEQFLALGPTDYIVQTSRGYHLYYSYPEGVVVPNQVKVDGKAVDMRGNGGYVIAPPSIHADGTVYQYFSQGTLGDLPEWCLETSTDQREVTVEHWITDVLKGVAKGDRNNQGIRLAGYYESKGIPLDICIGLLDNWDSHNQPPFEDPNQTRNIATGVYNTAARKKLPKITILPPVTTKDPTQVISGVLDIPSSKNGYIVDNWSGSTEDNEHKLEFIGLDEYGKQYSIDNSSWLIDNWLPENSVMMMVSPPESFKTWLGLDMLLSVAGGYPFLDQYKTVQGPVLMLQLEDEHTKTINRLDLIHHHKVYQDKRKVERIGDTLHIRTLPKLPFAVHPHRALNLLNMATMRGLEDAIREIQPKLVYIDPLYAAGSTQDYLASTAQHFGMLKLLRDFYHCSFLIAHHTKKVADKKDRGEDDRELSWGSQFVNAAIEGGLQIRQVPKEPAQITIVRHTKNSARPEKLQLEFDINTQQVPHHYRVNVTTLNEQAVGRTERANERLTDIREALAKRANQTVDELVTVLGWSDSTVRRYIKELIAAEEVKEKDKKYTLLEGARIL